ncbi:MAG: macro domain-containing protein [Chloroflexi bacterium]|jgi:O-acetyl-ADP-ribose deacetylase (regulator of RNase III)|nr:macro domain-containing protein [Chloroflexota bacterium]
MTRLLAWHGDICDLEVDAIVSPATVSLWMSSGVGAAIKKRGGDAIEIAAVRRAPVALGDTVVTPAGSLLAKHVIHVATLEAAHRTTPEVVAGAVRGAVRAARGIGARSLAIPALGAGMGGLDAEASARATVGAVRDELAAAPGAIRVIFALQDPETFEAYRDEIERTETTVTSA